MVSVCTLAPSEVGLANKPLISEQLWQRLVDRIVREQSLDRSVAERIMDQALGFLRLCAIDTTRSYSPSPLVDIGWHAFILYTREYAAFCDELAGRFIHHEPSDEPGVDYGTGDVALTVVALRWHGISVDEMLWVDAAQCETGCKASGCGRKA